MATMNIYEPCKAQKDIMKSLGFSTAFVNDDNHNEFRKARWVREQQGHISISILMSPNYTPTLTTVTWDIISEAYKEGQKAKINEIKKVMELQS